MFRSLCGFVAAALVITAAACAPVVPEDPNTIEITKVGSYSYMRQSRDLAIVVDVEMARKRTEEAYFPLGIKIANKRLGQVIVDRESLRFVDGTEIDFVRQGLNEAFKFHNPNVQGECGCGESFNV